MSGSYDSRILTLVANIPIALPPARQYVVLSASVNSSALGISIGDGNGDFTAWPAGLAIKFDRSIPARLISSVSQSVAIGFTDGGVTLVDSRNVPIGPTAATIIDGGDVALGARADAAATTDAGTFSLIALIKRLLSKTGAATPNQYVTAFTTGSRAPGTISTGNVNIVLGAGNTNGILITSANLIAYPDTTAVLGFYESVTGAPLFQVTDSQFMASTGPIIIPPGAGLLYNATGGGWMSITYKIL